MSIAELRDKTLEVMRLVLRGEISSHEAIAFEHLSKQYERLWGVAEKLARLEILEQRFAESSKSKWTEAAHRQSAAGGEAEE